MARPAHITTARAFSCVDLASACNGELLEAYSSWLFFERHFLLVGRFGVEAALGMMNIVATENAGAAFHLPASADLPDYSEPARRAALMLATAGVDIGKLRSDVQRSRDPRRRISVATDQVEG
jgi:hypothetical protein